MKIFRTLQIFCICSLYSSLVLLSGGCASSRNNLEIEEPGPLIPLESQIAHEPVSSAEIDAEWSPQVIRPGSLLNIQVYVGGNREVDITNARVADNGTITLPLIGNISIAGRPIETATDVLDFRYSNYFVSPQVTVDIVRDDDSDSFPWGFVTVLGRVKNQGRVAIPPTRDLTVSSAIQQAGGFATSARIRSIRVTRQLPDGESESFNINMRNIGRRGRSDQDIQLKPNDVVFIPEKLF